MNELRLDQKVERLHDALQQAGIPHAFGGAIALAYYAEPRITVDIDLNLFVEVAEAHKVESVLTELGIEWDVSEETLERDGQCRLRWGRNPVDLFFQYDAVHGAFERSLRRVPFGDQEIPVLGPEHLMVCKVVFDRAKDWLDLEQMMIYVDYVDPEEVLQWLRHLVGEQDQRYRRAEELLARRKAGF